MPHRHGLLQHFPHDFDRAFESEALAWAHIQYQIADSRAAQLQYWRQDALETLASSVQRAGQSDGWYQINVRTPFRAG